MSSFFGRTDTAGLVSPGAHNIGNIVGNVFTLVEDAEVSSISGVFGAAGAANAVFRGVIYPAASAFSPAGESPIAATQEVVAVAHIGGLVEAAFAAPVSLRAGAYYLGIWFANTSDTALLYDPSVGTFDWVNLNSYSPVAPPYDPFASSGTAPGTWGIFATYEPAVLPEPPPPAGTGVAGAMQDLAGALALIEGEIEGLQVVPFLNPNPTPPALDLYPGDPFQTGAGFGVGNSQAFFTIRARVSTADPEAGQRLLLRMLDPGDPASVEAAIEDVATVAPEGVSGFREYLEEAASNGRLLGCEWRVSLFL